MGRFLWIVGAACAVGFGACGKQGQARCNTADDCPAHQECVDHTCTLTIGSDGGDDADAHVPPRDAPPDVDAPDVDAPDEGLPDGDVDGPLPDGSDGPYTITLGTTASSVTVGSASSFTITMSPAPAVATEVYFTVGGTASTEHDADLDDGVVTIAADTTPARESVTFNVLPNTAYNGGSSKTLIISLDTGLNTDRGLVLGTYPTQTVSINSTVTMPTVNFVRTTETVAEGSSTQLSVSLDHASSVATRVYLDSAPGSGIRTSYNVATSISIGAYLTGADTTFTSYDNYTYDGSRPITMNFASTSGLRLGTDTVDTVTVTDDEPLPTVSFNDPTGTNRTYSLGSSTQSTVSLLVEVDPVSSLALTVPYVQTGTAVYGAIGVGDIDLASSGNIIIGANDSYEYLTFHSHAGPAAGIKTVTVELRPTPGTAVTGDNPSHTFSITTNP